ncbi:MAG: beta-propeller domain-containing protein [Firmicutes bacterium]|nr:beta-propeller domain-containing protein [Bacillota bacterium]
MNRYNNAFGKISASEQLKSETANRALSHVSTKRKSDFRVKLVAIATVTVFVLCLGFLGFQFNLSNGNVNGVVSLTRSAIINEIKNQTEDNPREDANSGWFFETQNPTTPESDNSTNSSGNSGNYAGTNVQTEGIDEGDIIKVDDNYIYVLSQAGLVIISVKNQMEISVKIDYDNFVPVELFILGDKLIVIGGIYHSFYLPQHSSGLGADVLNGFWHPSYQHTVVKIYDLNDRKNLILLSETTVDGYFETSRLINGELILITNYYFNLYNEETYIPKTNSKEIDSKNIFVCKTGEYRNYLIITSLNIQSQNMKQSAFLGLYSGTTYVSAENLYFFNTDYSSLYDKFYNIARDSLITRVYKINLRTLKCTATGKIDGIVEDRYYADEYNGNLRVVSFVQNYRNWQARSTSVFVLNANLKVMGKITGIAPDERIYSVRLKGNDGSIVTFRDVDPLFKLDLSNPWNPKVSKGLKEDGVNDYLQYLTKDYLLGLGRNTIQTAWGFVWGGMKIALYDMRGEDAVNIKHIDIGKNAQNVHVYSEALWNPKAILNDTAKNMFSIPVVIYEYGYANGNYKYVVTQGLMVFEYDLTQEKDEDKLIHKGFLTNLEAENDYTNDWAKLYQDSFSHISRGARVGDSIFTISQRYITSYCVNTLEETGKLEIGDFSILWN